MAPEVKLPLPCGCYDFDQPQLDPADGHDHCWHEQYFVTTGELRKQCGHCGTWKDVFDT